MLILSPTEIAMPLPKTMNAVEITTPGGPETLKLTTRSLPEGAIKPVIHATFALAEAAKAHVWKAESPSAKSCW
jgi:hypothetical protein